MGTILVTGGAGYIGSHTVLLLLEAGRRVLVLDNLSNSSRESLERVAAITGKRAEFVEGDIRDTALLDRLFQEHRIGSVIHFAGLKAVGESVAQPLRYYDCNVTGSLRLLEAMDRAGVRHLVFSSSATVYGDPASVPIREDFPLSATNPYGATKLHIEDMLRDLHRADDQREQSYSERQLYEAALERLTREVAAVSGADESSAQKQVDDVLVSRAAA